MKKIILFFALAFAITTVASAQGAAQRKEEIRKGLKEEVKLTDEQIAQVVAIDEEFRGKSREVKNNESLSEADKKSKTKSLNDEKKTKLETLLGKEKAEKTQAFYAALRKKPKDGETKKEQ